MVVFWWGAHLVSAYVIGLRVVKVGGEIRRFSGAGTAPQVVRVILLPAQTVHHQFAYRVRWPYYLSSEQILG